MPVYATCFNAAYEPRARVMVESLRSVGDSGEVLAVCFDDESMQLVGQWSVEGVVPVSVRDLVAGQPRLDDARSGRSMVEWFFTCTPWVALAALERAAPGDWATYLDADLVFYSSTDAVYAALGDANTGIVPHRWRSDRPDLLRYGQFNVGWVSFRATDEGRSVARWWGERCLEWCHDEVSGDRFADQGYLDSFATVTSGVVALTAPSIGLAPWNLSTSAVALSSGDAVTVDGEPLVFFHAHGLRRTGKSYVAVHRRYGSRSNAVVRDRIYAPYVAALVAAGDVQAPVPATRGRGVRGAVARTRRWWHRRQAVRDGDWWPIDAG